MLKRSGVALALWGEAGIGKTWTARHLLTQTPCKSFAFAATVALAKIARSLPGPPKLALWAETLLGRMGKGEHLEPGPAADALAALLAGLAPIVLHLEDLHEANPERLELITALAARVARSKGVALLVTSRTRPPEVFEAIRIEPLSSHEAQNLLENEVGASLPAEANKWIYARAKGNPLFTLEYFRHLARMGFLWNDAQRWHWRTPPGELMPLTVEALLEQQIQEVSRHQAVRKALEVKALLPQAPDPLWARVAGLEAGELEQAKQRLLEQGILLGSEFAHPLFREVSLKLLSPERKQALARQVIEALPDDPETAALFVKEAALAAKQALELLQRAAQSSRSRGDPVQAGRFLARAVDYAEGEERGRLALEAAQYLRNVDFPEATRLAEYAVVEQSSTEAIYLLAELLTVRGRIEEVERVLDRLPQTERMGIGWINRLIELRAKTGDYAGVVELWQAHPELHEKVIPDIGYHVAYCLSSTGNQQSAAELAQRILQQNQLDLEQRCRLISVLNMVYYYRGEYPQAEAASAEALALARQTGNRHLLAQTLFNRAYVIMMLGKTREAIQLREEAMYLYAELGNTKRYAHAQLQIANALTELGEYERAEELLLESRDLLLRMDVSEPLVDCERILSFLYLDWRPPYGGMLALKHAQAALDTAKQLNSPRNLIGGLLPAALAEASYGDPSKGLNLALQADDLARTLGQSWGVCVAWYARGNALKKLERQEEAIGAYREAYLLADQLGMEVQREEFGLEIDYLTQDSSSAARRAAFFESRGLGHKLKQVYEYFPNLKQFQAPSAQDVGDGSNRLGVLGLMQFGRAGAMTGVRGHKRKELLAALVEARIAGRAEVGTLELLGALYPGTPEAEAANLLKQAVFQARAHLGQGIIVTTPGGYALGSLETDAELFLKTGDTRLWRGGFLEDVGGDRDEAVRGALYQALLSKARGLLETDPHEAVRLGRILLAAEPYDPEILALSLRALQQEGNHKGLAKLYQQARTQMQEVGQLLPEGWQDFLGAHSA